MFCHSFCGLLFFIWENFWFQETIFSQQKLLNHYYVFSTRSACLWLLWIMNVNRFIRGFVPAHGQNELSVGVVIPWTPMHWVPIWPAVNKTSSKSLKPNNVLRWGCPDRPSSNILADTSRHSSQNGTTQLNPLIFCHFVSFFFCIFWNNMHTDEFLLVSIVNCWNQWAHCLLRSRQLTLGLSQSFA